MADDVQERSIANLQYQIQKKRNELEWEKDRITQLEKELASSKSKCIKYENKIRIIKKDFSLLNSDNKDLKHQIRASEVSIKRLTKDSLEKKRKEEELKQLITKITDLKGLLRDKIVEINSKDEILQDLTKQVEFLEERNIHNAISQVEKRKESAARDTEIQKLKVRINFLEGNLKIQKNDYEQLKAEHVKLEKSTNHSESFRQKKTYESYILTLQTELYETKQELEESARKRSKQKDQIERLESKFSSINLKHPQAKPPNILPLNCSHPNQDCSEKHQDHGKTQVSPSPTSLKPMDNERDKKLMEFFTKVTIRMPSIKVMAFIGHNGDLYFQTSPWLADNEPLKFIQDWQAKASTFWLKDLKFLTVYVDSEVLTATNEQGKRHLLCSVLDENSFVIILLQTTDDILNLYEDLKYLLPPLKLIFKQS